jgi:hypothetical protein
MATILKNGFLNLKRNVVMINRHLLFSMSLRWFIILILTLALLGCSRIGLPKNNEMNDVYNNRASIILLKLKGNVEGRPAKIFNESTGESNIILALGGFDSGGIPEEIVGLLRFLSKESLKKGYTYLILKPGTYFLTLTTPYIAYAVGDRKNLFKKIPRWQFSVNEGSKFIYIGTMHLTGNPRWMISGADVMEDIIYDQVYIDNDFQEARNLIKNHFPENGDDLTISLLQKYEGGPIYLRHPLSD